MAFDEINSSSEVVKGLTKEMVNTIIELKAVPEAVLDSKTTLSGNNNAQQAIALLQSTLDEIATVLNDDLLNLQLIADEFEMIDSEIKNKFEQLET